MFSDLMSVIQGFMDSTGGFLLVIFIGGLIFMGTKSKPTNGGSKGSTSNNNNNPQQ